MIERLVQRFKSSKVKSLVFLNICTFVLLYLVSFLAPASAAQQPELTVHVFHMPTCHACVKTINNVVPPLAKKYGGRVAWEYIDITNEKNYKKFIELELKINRTLSTPSLLVGEQVLVGFNECSTGLDKAISRALALSSIKAIKLEGNGVSLLERFKSFGPLAVILAGLIDGVNPCAFTVIVFFVSFLTVMGYRRREMFLIGLAYILAVFLTYLALGLGFFNALYGLKGFFLVSQLIYIVIGGASLYLGALAIKDYFIYRRTGTVDAMALQLPKAIKNKIHAIVGEYYRKDKSGQRKALLGLVTSAFVVGFMISLLEAVCTGQMYLPTIVFMLKDASLRAKAFFYLVVYNIMFVIPLFFVFAAALAGYTSKQFEAFARGHMGLIKLSMAAVFLALGFVLLSGLL
jgi:cytochrome c biogenesis protein CcdA